MSLLAGRWQHAFSGFHLTTSAMQERFNDVENIGIRWNLESFGVERIEVTVRSSDDFSVRERLENHFGKRLAVYDPITRRPISGFIVDVQLLDNRRVMYVAKGPGWRLYDGYGPTYTSYTNTTTTSFMIQKFLDDDNYIVGSDFGNLDETSTNLASWHHTPKRGDRTGDVIKQFQKMANSSGQLWDFWMQDQTMLGTQLREFNPYFKNRANRTTADWYVKRSDVKNLTPTLSMADFRSQATVFYGGITGTATGGSATTLVDSTADFLNGTYAVNDAVFNITDHSQAKIREIVSATTLNLSTLTDGSANVFANTNVYAIHRQTLVSNVSVSKTFSDPFFRQIAEHQPEFHSSQATNYATALRDLYGYPAQSASFTITAPFILDADKAPQPLHRVIERHGGIIMIEDLYPTVSQLSNKQNRLNSFFITALDYDHTANQLRVAVDVPDGRLDARLKAAKILGSELVARG